MQLSLTLRFAQAMAGFEGALRGGPLGLAVSGGSDSTALLLLAVDWAKARGVPLGVATVDHRLRPEAAAEAQAVGALCARLGLAHQTLVWRERPASGNLPDLARRARLALLGGWAADQGLAAIALGHTLDDQAETFLLRLARGSGVDGLAAMAPLRRAHGTLWLRPLLGERREDLRAMLRANGTGWCDDPGNADTAYDRVKMRQALALLAPLGMTAEALAATAGRMASARQVLQGQTFALAESIARVDRGDLLLDAAGLFAAPEDLRCRLVAQALRFVASADYRPRHAALLGLLARLAQGGGGTLLGCLAAQRRGVIRITREARALRGVQAAPGMVWDGRWRVTGPDQPGDTVAMLGAGGLALCPGWRGAGLPRASLIASPAVWRADRLIAAPLAGFDAGWRAEPAEGCDTFSASILSH